jgi:hypothetical protein
LFYAFCLLAIYSFTNFHCETLRIADYTEPVHQRVWGGLPNAYCKLGECLNCKPNRPRFTKIFQRLVKLTQPGVSTHCACNGSNNTVSLHNSASDRELLIFLFLIFKSIAYKENYSHSIIKEPRQPAWLLDFAMIDKGLYRRFYRQKRTSFACAGDGAICGASTPST